MIVRVSNAKPMNSSVLIVDVKDEDDGGGGGDDDDDDDDDEDNNNKRKRNMDKYYGVDKTLMITVTVTAHQSRSIICTCPIFFMIFAWLLTVTDTSPLHLPPPHKGIIHGSYIAYYEAAFYDVNALKRNRSRMRRDIEDNSLILQVKTFDRLWTIRLVRDRNLFAEDAVFESTDGMIPFDTSHSYTGTVVGEETAVVQGIITQDGLFDGTITTGIEEYYIEPTDRYLTGKEDTSPPYHSIAYRASDVTKPSFPISCASQQLHENSLHKSFDRTIESLEKDRVARHVQKRATVDPRKTTCMLYLQADHQFFARHGTEESCIEVMTRHVQRVNSIYKHTDFNQDGRPDNISFMIKRIKVHSEGALKDPNYRFPGSYGVEKYLELFSEEDYDAFCLAYMFTYRDFEMGTLGLAWTGDLKNAGGVCEKNGHYRGSMKSLNTGIVTLLNYGKHVPPAVSHVTLAHEIGHNFGSPHDPEQCTPGGEDGNFIMFARATSGDKRNNNRFSPCSLNAINPVLNTKARSPRGCFTEPQVSLCGNGVVEEGEECDCGWEEDCNDSCCFPQRRYPPPGETPCMLTPGAVCSPSQGPCCTTKCNLKFGDKCRDDNGCRDASFCDGRSPYCPPSINKPNKTICNREFVCFMGECTGSICLAYGLESCQCIPGPNDPSTKACELCCRLPGEQQPCLSSFEWNSAPYDIPDLFAKPGTPCNDYNGYCDVFQKCREVDPNGPLATLRKLLLSEESLASFRRLMIENWHLTTLIIFGVLSVLMIVTRLLAKQSDLKLKSVTIIHSSTTETVRLPPEGAEGVTVHPPVVREKLPLSKKVRENRRRRKHNKERKGIEVEKHGKSEVGKKKSQLIRAKRSSTAPTNDGTTAATAPSQRKKLSPKEGKPLPPIPDTGNNNNSAPTSHEETRREENEKKKRKKPHKKEEVIDYSAMQTEDQNNDPKDKVRSWLLASSQCAEDGNMGKMLKSDLLKSTSTPAELTTNAVATTIMIPPSKRLLKRCVEQQKESRNVGRKDRARLQVVYKPPFRFTVKLRKADKVTQTPAGPDNARSSKPLRTAVLLKANKKDKARIGRTRQVVPAGIKNNATDLSEVACSDLHTIPSDLEVLLSESEFLFSDT